MSKVQTLVVTAVSAFMHEGNVINRGTKVELEPGEAYNLVNRGKAELVPGQDTDVSSSDSDGDVGKDQILAHIKTLTVAKLVQFAKDNKIDIDEKANKDEILAVVLHAVEENYPDADAE